MKHRSLTLIFIFVTGFVGQAFAVEPNPRTAPLSLEHPRYLDVRAPLDERVADLLSRMTLEEKALALMQRAHH